MDRYFKLIPKLRATQYAMNSDEQLRRFGERLREMRILMAANQQDFAALGGVKKNSQVTYETGKTAPTVEYLYRLAGHGVDIGYILTGRREDGSQGDEERLLIDLFAKLDTRERDAIMTMLASLTGKAADAERPVERPSRTLHAPRPAFRGEGDN
jgi:transcriptional regulator with XRE-family HTH domain